MTGLLAASALGASLLFGAAPVQAAGCPAGMHWVNLGGAMGGTCAPNSSGGIGNGSGSGNVGGPGEAGPARHLPHPATSHRRPRFTRLPHLPFTRRPLRPLHLPPNLHRATRRPFPLQLQRRFTVLRWSVAVALPPLTPLRPTLLLRGRRGNLREPQHRGRSTAECPGWMG